jgi:beta-glucosidase
MKNLKIFFVVLFSFMLIPEILAHDKISSNTPQQNSFVDSLINIMTLDEKIGQLVLFSSHWELTGPAVSIELEKMIREGKCGNIFNAYYVDFNKKLQEIAVNETRLGIPLLFGYDVIHGFRTIFPIGLGEASSWNLALIERASRIAAVEATASGVHWTFAPMVDISKDPRWGRISESSGEDPYLGSEIARVRVRGFQGSDLNESNTMLSCVKHFAAYGAAQAGRDYNPVDMSERMLRDVYLPPFKAAIDEGATTIMTSFNEINGVPATSNPFLLHNILRDEWGFNGFVVSDYTAVKELIEHGVAENDSQAAQLAFDAGLDMDMQSSVYLNELGLLVKSGQIEESKIDEAVKKILSAKVKLGLFDDPYKYFKEENLSLLASEKHMKAAYKMASESAVLLKNSNNILPIKKSKKLAVIGHLANQQRDLLGSWKADGYWDEVQTIYQAIASINGEANTSFEPGYDFENAEPLNIEKVKSIVRESDAVILVLGEPWDWSGEAASRSNINIPDNQKKLLKEISNLDKPVVVVLLNGRPLTLEDEHSLSTAMLEAWYPGSMGAQAIADILFGKVNPSGKLPVTFPRNLGQVPISYSDKNTGRPYDPEGMEQKYLSRYIDVPNSPLFPFGYGLSYTQFDYSDLQLNKQVITRNDTLEISIMIKNSGDMDGKEIVQLYVRDLVGSVTRPLKELKGFQKLDLKSGQEKKLVFHLTADDLTFFTLNNKMESEPGQFTIWVGKDSSSGLSANFELID